MKKAVFLLITATCILGISGCGRAKNSADKAGGTAHCVVEVSVAESMVESTGENTEESIEKIISLERKWTEQDIRSLFAKGEVPGSWTITDCTVAEDYAYGCVGVVLFTDSENHTSNVAFMREDGTYQRCGIHAKTRGAGELAYLGDGAVTFQAESGEGSSYTCKVTFSVENSNVSFIVENDL